MRAIQQAGHVQLILLSSYGVGNREDGIARRGDLYAILFRAIARDKRRAEMEFRRSCIDGTLVYPVSLTDGFLTAVDVRLIREVNKVGTPSFRASASPEVLLDPVEGRRNSREELQVSSGSSVR